MFVRNQPLLTRHFCQFHRIERLWRDVYMAVTNVFYSVLHTLEDDGHLDLSSELHLFCCHYVFIPRLQASLDVFREGWDNHSLKSEQNMSPNQLWELGQLQCPVPDPDVTNVCKKKNNSFALQIHEILPCNRIKMEPFL